MKYNFSKMTNRRHTHSLKWDVLDHELPMWVADMDFEVAPEIIETLHQRVEHGIFGYNNVPREFFISISKWWKDYHDFEMKEDWMLFCSGVVPAISSVVRRITTVGENVLILSPVYNIFYNSILNNGRHVLSSDLIYDGENYSIDFDDLERKLSLPQTTLMIFCNPHNPIGKIWDRDTLIRVGELCYKHHVVVISDEIHCDLIQGDHQYIPFASVSKHCLENTVTCIAPTKAFNMAGLQCACLVIENEVLRHKVNRGINTDEVAEPNSFACLAAITAFKKGKEWLDELNAYILENKDLAYRYIGLYLPELKVTQSCATYLLWIDCQGLTDDTEELIEFIRKETGLFVSRGKDYGENGKAFMRMNVACPRDRLKDGLTRLNKGVHLFIEKA